MTATSRAEPPAAAAATQKHWTASHPSWLPMPCEGGEGKQEGNLHHSEGTFKMRTAAAGETRLTLQTKRTTLTHVTSRKPSSALEATRCNAANFLTCCWSDAMDVHRAADVGAAQAM